MKVICAAMPLLSLAALLLLASAPAAADERSKAYREAYGAFRALRDAALDAQVAAGDTAGTKGTRRKQTVARARDAIAKGRAAAKRLRTAIEAVKKVESWKNSAALLERKLAAYEARLREAETKLAALGDAPPEDGKGEAPPKQPTVDQPLGEDEPEAGGGIADALDPEAVAQVRLDLFTARWDVQEMLEEFKLWEAFADAELRGQTLLERAKAAMSRHGATHHYAQTWAMWLGHYTHGGLSPWGNWNDLLQAVVDFSGRLSVAKDLSAAEQAYVLQLRDWMQLWRRDARRKARLLLQAVDAMARMAVAYEANDDAQSKSTRDRYSALVDEIKRPHGHDITKFEAWRDAEAKAEEERKRRAEEYKRKRRAAEEKKRRAAEHKRKTKERTEADRKRGTRSDGSTLSDHDVKVMINAAKKKLKAKGLPTAWLDDVRKNPPEVSIDVAANKGKKAGGTYNWLTNKVSLPSPVNVVKPSNEDLKPLVHELFHYWYDTVPDVDELWMDLTAEETVAEFLALNMRDQSLSYAIDEAIEYGLEWGGDVGDALEGLRQVHDHFGEEGLLGGFRGPGDRENWEKVKKDHLQGFEQETAALEQRIRK